MPRKNLIRTNESPYHITARCNNKDNFYLPKQEVWKIFAKYLRYVTVRYQVKVHSFVLMSNHFHLLITTPESNIDEVMYWVMKGVTLDIQQRTGRINRIFGSRYKWSVIDNDHYYHQVYKYVALNPVKANLIKTVQAYRFSTFHFLYFRKNCSFQIYPFFEKEKYFENSTWTWLNEKYDDETNLLIKNGIRKSIYKGSSTLIRLK